MTDAQKIVCYHCGALNKVPGGKNLNDGKCGSCHEGLSTPEPVDIDNAMFDKLTGRDTGFYVIDIWAPWCGPCRAMVPAYRSAAQAFERKIRLFKLNSDDNKEAASRLDIRGIPTLAVYNSGKPLALQPGAQTEPQLKKWLTELAGSVSLNLIS